MSNTLLDESKKPSYYSFSELPDEIITIILRNLDLQSLCRMSRVNKRFNNLAQNHLLYINLNLEPYCYIVNTKALYYLTPRCKYLRQLNLSYCRGISVQSFEFFLVFYGSLLTHLQLTCLRIDNNTILRISRVCKNLKELDVGNCYMINDNGFSYLKNLKFLECLNLCKTYISTETLCKILRRNIRMRHLYIAETYTHLNADEVIMELRNSCPDLESIDLQRIHTLTSQGINALADYKNLRNVNLTWCKRTTDHGDSFFRLFSSCQHLETILLGYVKGFTECDLKALTLCKNLKQLFLMGTPIPAEICHTIFVNCSKLELIDLSFCKIANWLLLQWQQKYIHITIKAYDVLD
ncbi:PREDICTED: F-box/LRR-repeat protein 4-like [Atta colombica]|uniref:F-box/LRR-repeat protein 4-like n=1 Tax=Atta colombica TaxID=520822 RepID=UPI00084C81BB|nr:PREDICTED: F-box/LRR-repeat protein 4-like [Atta colombica]